MVRVSRAREEIRDPHLAHSFSQDSCIVSVERTQFAW